MQMTVSQVQYCNTGKNIIFNMEVYFVKKMALNSFCLQTFK